jgi:hypothetical protein
MAMDDGSTIRHDHQPSAISHQPLAISYDPVNR